MKLSEKQKKMIQGAIAPTIVATLIFFVTYFFFGMENTMIGPFATLSFLRYRNMCSHYECLIRNFAVYMIMAVLSFLAVINLPLCILINAVALFWIADLLIDEYNPNNYFPAGMALIFFQIAPIHTVTALGNRLLALLASFGIVFLFAWILSRNNAGQNRLKSLIAEGFSVCEDLLAQTGYLVGDTDRDSNIPHSGNLHASSEKNSAIFNAKRSASSSKDVSALHKQLCEINQKCSKEIYSANRATLRMKGKTNWYCRFVLVFQILNYLTDHAEEEDNRLNALNIYRKFKAQFQEIEPTSDYRRLNFRVRKPDIRNMRLRFALRQVIVLTPCLVISYLWQSNNIYWLVISVFFMMIPFTEHTVQRVRQRVFGTMAGIVLCFIFFTVFPDFGSRVVIMTVANFMIYAADGYGPTVAFITCSALALQSIDSSIPIVLGQRLIYTLLGGGIALLSNRCVFPVRVTKQMQYLFDMLRSLREQLTVLGENTTPGDDYRRHQMDQLIIKSYLLSNRVEDLQESLPEIQKFSGFEDARKRHMGFLAAYLAQYMA
ncbi:FUSC family protein [uncultured Eubacterium sp.]|uniref:FUSC family protein n=1 Tax=uncultured Eubacterium sp. TaxID=165185 RepID=UPI0025FA627B|nr:FUSC family protein [uncultured Eubacterium sp.]